MKKLFTRNLCLYMSVALLLTIIAIFTLQTFVSKDNNTQSSHDKLASVQEKLTDNEAEIAKLTENLGENNLAKSRAFADLLAEDPSILNSSSRLDELKDRLMVNELHVIDAKGIITHSTISAYIGFDMTSGEQSAAFMVIVDDPSIELVQEPQLNAAEGILMQYIGVARKDAKGLVQVGIRPEILEEMLANTQINAILKDIDFGDTGYIYAIDKNTGLIAAHPDDNLIGTPAADAGFSVDKSAGKAKVNGTSGYFVAEEYGENIIGTFLPSKEYYSDRLSQTLVVSLSMLLIFIILLIMINRMVDKKIVRGINNISRSMKAIAEGNFDTTVKEQGNPEFKMLSDNINKMVAGIRDNLQENEELLAKQKEDMESNLSMIRNVKEACANLGNASKETLSNALDIYNGTEEQKIAVSDLEQLMTGLVTELNSSADVSTEVTENTENTAKEILQMQSQMELLKTSMEKISEMSMAIETIIGEINSIAQQTNMLSLNASIEAARAGEMGRGFAVVATQVGELATRSAQAARETNELITNSIQAVEDGREITDQTVSAFVAVAEDIQKASESVSQITDMVKQNALVVSNTVKEINKISYVVEKNVEISQNSKQVSAAMADETERLLQLVEA